MTKKERDKIIEKANKDYLRSLNHFNAIKNEEFVYETEVVYGGYDVFEHKVLEYDEESFRVKTIDLSKSNEEPKWCSALCFNSKEQLKAEGIIK